MRLRSHVREARAVLVYWLKRVWRLRPRNWVDPITLERLHSPIFRLIDAHGHVHAFDPETLAAYFRTSGHFINPVTRDPVNNVELRRLQKLLPASDPPLVDARQQLEDERQHAFRREANMHAMQMQIELTFHDLLAYAISPQFNLAQYRSRITAIRHALANLAATFGEASARATAEMMQTTTLNWLTVLMLVEGPYMNTQALINLDQRMIPDVASFVITYLSDSDVIMVLHE